MTSEGVDAYGGEHVVSARTARAAPLSPVLPEDRPALPPRQNSAARRLRRQTPRRRAGACIFSEHRRRTPNARTEETVRATDSGAHPAVGRWCSDLLPGAGRCGRSRQKKIQKKPGKCCYYRSPLIRPLDRRSATYLCHEGILLSCGSSSLWKRRKCAQQKYGRWKCAQWKCGWWKCARRYGRRKSAQWKCGRWKCAQKYGRRKCAAEVRVAEVRAGKSAQRKCF